MPLVRTSDYANRRQREVFIRLETRLRGKQRTCRSHVPTLHVMDEPLWRRCLEERKLRTQQLCRFCGGALRIGASHNLHLIWSLSILRNAREDSDHGVSRLQLLDGLCAVECDHKTASTKHSHSHSSCFRLCVGHSTTLHSTAHAAQETVLRLRFA